MAIIFKFSNLSKIQLVEKYFVERYSFELSRVSLKFDSNYIMHNLPTGTNDCGRGKAYASKLVLMTNNLNVTYRKNECKTKIQHQKYTYALYDGSVYDTGLIPVGGYIFYEISQTL